MITLAQISLHLATIYITIVGAIGITIKRNVMSPCEHTEYNTMNAI